MNIEHYKKLYTLVNNLMAKVSCEGEISINTMDDIVGDMMDVLFDIDGGAFDNEEYGYIEKQLADNSEEVG